MLHEARRQKQLEATGNLAKAGTRLASPQAYGGRHRQLHGVACPKDLGGGKAATGLRERTLVVTLLNIELE